MSQNASNSPKNAKSGDSRPKAPGQFAHLHLHTSYSLLDGAIGIKDLMKHTKAIGQEAVAMTDHGNMFGAIEFYKAAVAEGIKPIVGLEAYVAPGDRFIKKTADRIADGGNYHMILLATNKTGYRNLIKMASRSYTEGYYRKPRIDYDLLANNSEGIVGLTACLAGEVQRKLLQGKDDEASRLAGHLKEVFRPGHFFLEIQNHGLPEDDLVTKGNLEIAKRQGLPLALTNDAHFLTRNDHAAQDILLRINQKKTMDDDLHFGFNPEFYVKDAAEMYGLFPEIPEAFHNTHLISEMVDLDFTFGNPLLPRFDVPEGHTLDTYLYEIAWQGLEKRYPGAITDKVKERFDFEYNTITKMDFPGYFLIVQDFINWAKQNGIPVGPGRGSAAGSIIAYSLGITDIDPLKYNLLFERFLNPDRNEMPDIDIDFCTERREVVINYVREKYGHDHVGQIITYGTMAAKACLKDVARVLNIPFAEANEISKKFPDVLNIGIDDALDASRDLRQYAESGDIQKHLFTVAKTLEGNARHTGIHAAGVVIAPEPLEQIVPMATVAQKSQESKGERVPVTQYDKDALEAVGLVKMDFLGLRNLTVIDHCVREIEKRTGQTFDLSNLPDDPATYKMLQKGDVAGVFQLESAGMREFVLKTKPSRFEDIVALIALFRPGPLQAGMADSFINRKNGREKVTYPHESLKEVLEDTYGVIVYQEQVMLISRIIGGFTPGESDALRKAMGKKIHEKMEMMRVKFVEGAVAQGYKEKFAADLYELMAQFASYGFNKSHSAAYAAIVYQTAYLKCNYPTDYMRSVLDSEIDRTERLVHYINACREMSIKILGPDVNESGANFTYIEDNVIRFGLGGVKNVGGGAVDSIIQERAEVGNKYKNFLQVMEHIDLRLCNRRSLESLIFAGAFDGLGYTRKALISSVEMAIQHGQRHQADRESGQTSLFGAVEAAGPVVDPIPRGEHVEEYDEQEILKNEKEVLGFYFSGHPIARYERILQTIKAPPIKDLDRLSAGRKIEIAGVITEISMRPTRTGKEMARIVVEDMTGSMNGVVFPNTLTRVRTMLVKDEPLLILGTLEKREETGTPQLILDGIKELNRDELEKKLERALHLKLNYSVDTSVIAHLQTILKSYSGGPLTVFFHLAGAVGDSPQVIRAHESFSVNLNEDMVARLQKVEQVKGIYLSVGEQLRPLHKAS